MTPSFVPGERSNSWKRAGCNTVRSARNGPGQCQMTQDEMPPPFRFTHGWVVGSRNLLASAGLEDAPSGCPGQLATVMVDGEN
jgi:hypothetical protein